MTTNNLLQHLGMDVVTGLIENTLSPDQEKSAMKHVEICPLCQKEMKEVEAQRHLRSSLLNATIPEAPDHLASDIRHRLARERTKSKRFSSPLGPLWLPAAATLLIVMGGMLATHFFRHGFSESPKTPLASPTVTEKQSPSGGFTSLDKEESKAITPAPSQLPKETNQSSSNSPERKRFRQEAPIGSLEPTLDERADDLNADPKKLRKQPKEHDFKKADPKSQSKVAPAASASASSAPNVSLEDQPNSSGMSGIFTLGPEERTSPPKKKVNENEKAAEGGRRAKPEPPTALEASPATSPPRPEDRLSPHPGDQTHEESREKASDKSGKVDSSLGPKGMPPSVAKEEKKDSLAGSRGGSEEKNKNP